jgi:hypothetical protein
MSDQLSVSDLGSDTERQIRLVSEASGHSVADTMAQAIRFGVGPLMQMATTLMSGRTVVESLDAANREILEMIIATQTGASR